MQSPFKNILYTNTAPSDSQCQTIRDFLVAPREEIAALTDEIVTTQALLDALTQRRAAVEEFVSAHLALVSPIRRLPADVMQEIFAACLPSDRNSVIDEQDAPLLLCHTCRSWRILALSTPRLWASLHIVLPLEDDLPSMNEAVNGWVSRSGILPLSISIAAPGYGSSSYHPSTLFHTLMALSPRWRHISFNLPFYDSFGPLASISPADVPVLQTLVLKGFNWASSTFYSGTPSIHLGFIGTASLRSVSIPAGAPDSTLTPFRWEHLRRLCFQPSNASVSADKALTILHKCPLLEMLSLHLTGRDSPPAPATLCHMEYLRDLHVFEGVAQTSNIFQHIVAPNLAHLEYSGRGPDLPFTAMLPSSRSLEGLSLTARVQTNSLLHTLALIPNLRRLLIQLEPVGEFDSLFISLLNRPIPEAGGILCPNLECIHLNLFHVMSDQALLDFIRTRADSSLGTAPRLSRVRVVFQREQEIDIIPPLQRFIDEGLEVSLQYRKPQRVRRPYSPSDALERHDQDWFLSPDFWS
ncbi:hypothetical protein DFH07DRAFT_261913 [Mycena maculata]|uniref:F-box domain-containing protein n=1 Tax=Mycena maculata TaxID=230809 RepID=A0AAD7HP64_9AGAR|nr:hypothetical protein DFH07DRAFT_261913 [Mycena maculata]